MYLKKISQKYSSTNMLVLIVLLVIFSSCKESHPPAENIVLNPLFTDNMVLQQNQEIHIWGTAKPKGKITVKFDDIEKSAIADTSGKWFVDFPPKIAGGPYELIIRGKKTYKIKNVMIGEVWLCSGQSNMGMPLAGWVKINNYQEEIENAKYPNIRLLVVEQEMANTPQEDIKITGWKECSPKTISGFSAVAYFFGRELHKELNVPIGLIKSAWGGTVIEAWISGKTLKRFPEFTDTISYIETDKRTDEEKLLTTKKQLSEWPDKIEKILKDAGTLNHGFQDTNYNTQNWKTMKLPSFWEDAGIELDGVVWFSKSVNLSKNWSGKELTLSLGKINDYDITWFNGKKVGRGTDVADFRVYKIAAPLVKKGNNKITVEVLDIGNVGGLYGPAKEMKLIMGDSSIVLSGNWKYKIDPIKIDIKKIPKKPTNYLWANRPTVLYNAMINPLLPYGIKGAIWYQGESNAERAYQYRTLFKSLIKDWRHAWDIGDFPFLFVQLANFKKYKSTPSEDSWAELREAQSMALELPNTGMAVTIDIGDAKDIHPKNKQEVGRRLALNALAKVYDKKIPYSGPLYKAMKIEGNKIRLQFSNTDKGLKIKGSKNLKGFVIAGADKKFVWARAKIDGDEVVVWNSKIKNPVAVRYGWAANPVCNLYNGAELPASPFRTDNWKGITFGKK